MQFSEILFLILTYFIAAIPFGFILAKIFAKVDIRQVGSKNIGATNVTRVAGKKLGLLTLVLDGLKGAIMVIIARFVFVDSQNLQLLLNLTALVAVIAHICPIYLKFRGGKGVATTIAVFLSLDLILGLVVVAIWLAVFALFRISSISALIAIFGSVIYSIIYFNNYGQIIFTSTLFLLVLYRHQENIIRLIKGEEKQINK